MVDVPDNLVPSIFSFYYCSYLRLLFRQMDTVLNLGMNDDVVEGLAKKTDNPRFAWDSYR